MTPVKSGVYTPENNQHHLPVISAARQLITEVRNHASLSGISKLVLEILSDLNIYSVPKHICSLFSHIAAKRSEKDSGKIYDRNFEKGISTSKAFQWTGGRVLRCGTKIVSASNIQKNDHKIIAWDLESGKKTEYNIGHTRKISCIAMSGAHIVSGSYDKTVRTLDLNTGAVATLGSHPGKVTCVAANEDKIISGSFDGTIKIWDLKTKVCEFTSDNSGGPIYNLAISNDKLVVERGSGLEIWDLEKQELKQIIQYEGHHTPGYSMAVVNGKVFWRGPSEHSKTGNIHVLDVNTGVMEQVTGRKKWELEAYSANDPAYPSQVTALAAQRHFATFKPELKLALAELDTQTFHLHNYLATDKEVFQEIAAELESGNESLQKKALDRFDRMPEAARKEIILQISNRGKINEARWKRFSPLAKASAIRAYLKSK